MKVIRKILTALLAVVAFCAHAEPVQHAFLVQNSGWMEPFYVDAASQFKPLIAAVGRAVVAPQDKVFALAFSQSNSNNVSPALLFKSVGVPDISKPLAGLTLAKKGSNGALADTDFTEAVSKTIVGHFKSSPGILWIFTNNKNSPNNDPETAERNRDFYRILHLEPSIVKTLAFPLGMQVRGRLYSASGLMVYALAYGDTAAKALDRIMAEGKLSTVLTAPPARLKPIDQDPVRIVPTLVTNSPNIKARIGDDRRTLMLDIDASKLVPTVTLQATMENLFYPYVISTARVDANLTAGKERTSISVTPAMITGLQPGAAQSVEVQFTLPIGQIPSAWSLPALAAMGKQVVIPLVVNIGLSEQKLALSEKFNTEMRGLFPGDPISEVFVPPDTVRTSNARVPMLVRIQYPLLPLFLLIATVLALILGAVGLIWAGGKSARYEVSGDESKRFIVMKPFSSLTVRNVDGEILGTVRRGLGRPRVIHVAEGHTLQLTGR